MWIVPEAELSKQPAQLRERADEDRAAWATPHTDRHAAVDGRQPVEVGEEGGRVGIPYIRAITFAWLAALRKAHSAGERDERANAPARCPPSLSDRAAAGSAPVHRRKPWLPGRRQARGRAVRRRSPLRTRHDRARRAARQHDRWSRVERRKARADSAALMFSRCVMNAGRMLGALSSDEASRHRSRLSFQPRSPSNLPFGCS
jgi:hypothetical protein